MLRPGGLAGIMPDSGLVLVSSCSAESALLAGEVEAVPGTQDYCGVFVPGLPTTVFILVAAYAASRGSERLHRHLVTHPRFGPMIHDWHLHRAVSRRAKWAATWTMLFSAVILLALMRWTGSHRWWMVALPMACMAVVGAWLWMRPEPPRSD